MRNYGRGASPMLPIYVVLLFLYSFILLSQAGAGAHLMDELGIIPPNEKIEVPDFELKDLNGQTVKLRDYRGKIVFLNFWATWCLPCREEMASMERLYSEFKDKDFALLAVDLQEDSREVTEFRGKYRLSFPILLDSDGIVGLTYGARLIPITYLVDRGGSIIGRVLGAHDWSSKESFAFFDRLLNLNSSSPPR